MSTKLNRDKIGFKKRSAKRRTDYDKSQLDIAVDLVLKNKLSLRAASHIYKIPFSTLRTRKIFVSQHSNEFKSSPTQNSNDCDENIFDLNEYEDIEDDEDSYTQDLAQKEQQKVLNSLENEPNSDIRNKPLKLHNIKNTNNQKKSEALMVAAAAAAASNHKKPKPSLNSIIDKLKNSKFKLKLNKPNSIISGRVSKKNHYHHSYHQISAKPAKRLYIKHDKLDNLFQTKSIDIVNDLLENDQKNIHELLAETNSSINKAKSSLASLENNSNPTHIKKSQPFKLASILSSTTLSLKNKANKSHTQHISVPKQDIRDIQTETKTDDKQSMLDSLKKYIIQTSDDQSVDNNNNLFKCKSCKLLFIDINLLNEHQSSCNYENEQDEMNIFMHLSESESDDGSDQSNNSSSNNNIILFRCSFCKKTFLNKLSFVSHIVLCSKNE